MNIIEKIFKKRSVDVYPFSASIVSSSTFNSSNLDATSLACMDLICSTVASLPLDLYDRKDKTKQVEHYLHNVFKDPNADETRFTFFYNLTRDYFFGNVYVYIYYNSENEISALFRLDPSKMNVQRDSFNRKVFSYNNKKYDSRQILHIPSRWGYDGLVGKSIFSVGSNTFDVSAELDGYTNNAFNNSLGKRLVIDISTAFPNATPEQVEALRQKYISNYTGQINAGKPIIKSNKIGLETIDSGLPDNRANQLIENREFQEKEISKLFGVPLSFLKGENKYGDVESLYQILLDTAIRPITTIFEESFNKLLYLNEREKMIFEYNYNALLKTSLQNRMDSYTKQLTHGILSINEVRRKENLQPIEAGNVNILSGGNFFPLTLDNLNAYMASAKIKAAENNIGSDRQ